MAQNLRGYAKAAGVDPARLIFADKVGKPEHLARHKQADLFLDTFFYTAHTTASDALYVGLPVLTTFNSSFASRVSASIVLAAGLPELVAPDQRGFVDRAVELARRPRRLDALKQRLRALLIARTRPPPPSPQPDAADFSPAYAHLPLPSADDVARVRAAFPLFDAALFARGIECAAEAAFARFACGQPPQALAVNLQQGDLEREPLAAGVVRKGGVPKTAPPVADPAAQQAAPGLKDEL